MNTTECDALYADVAWTEPSSLLTLIVLLLITLMVIAGNLLVIAAVYYSSKLRTVTNLFIVSLAVADFLVGVAVLPFSSPLEVYKVWLFGDIWCSVWLAVDVWMCTASILNLCAISLDRYVAVTRPVKYPSIMSSSRAKYLIAGVWILSFVICFPPLVGWKEPDDASTVRDLHKSHTGIGTVRIRGEHTVIEGSSNATDDFDGLYAYHTNFSEHIIDTRNNDETSVSDGVTFRTMKLIRSRRSVSSFSGVPVLSGVEMFDNIPSSDMPDIDKEVDAPTKSVAHHCPWVCELTNDAGYVIYSALGSFFIPMTVMLFFYWRIYRAAMLTTRAINQGFRTTKGTGAFGNRFDEQRLTLRIHRGRGSQTHSSTCSSHTNLTSTTNGGHSSLSASPSTTSTGKSPEPQRLHRTASHSARHEPVKISVSYPSSDQISSVTSSSALSVPRASEKTPLTPSLRRSSVTTPKRACFSVSPPRKNYSDFPPKRSSQPKNEVMFAVHYSNKNGRELTETSVCRGRDANCYLRVSNSRASGGGHRSLSIDSTNSAYDDEPSGSRRNSTKSQVDEGSTRKDLSPSPTYSEQLQKQKSVPKMGKRNIKAQVKRFRMETKAAKTLAIIVGGFIVCWMPFFTIYLIRAFCDDCINPAVFSVLFWLGYCNSAINPCIYALFSKDFRFAFKKIICRCLCGKEQPLNLVVKRRGSDASGIKTPVHGRRRSVSHMTGNSAGDDSDPGGGDSR